MIALALSAVVLYAVLGKARLCGPFALGTLASRAILVVLLIDRCTPPSRPLSGPASTP